MFFSLVYIFYILLHSQMPSPYRGLVYADLTHSTTSNTGPVKREFPTVYNDIDYIKTYSSSKLPDEHLDPTSECNVPQQSNRCG